MNAQRATQVEVGRFDSPRFAVWTAAIVAFLLLSLYVATLCPTVYISGTGENITAAATLGVPHPPGFPLYCLLGRVCVSVSPASPAATVNFLSALCMALASGVLAWCVARWTGVWGAGAVTGFLFGVARVPWSQAVIGEVYGLSALLMALELTLLLAWRGNLGVARGIADRRRLLVCFGLVFGLGVSVHPLHAMLVPGYIVLVWTAERRDLAAWPLAAVAGLLGMTLHFYTPLRSALDPALDWGNPEGGAAFIDYITASQYRSRMFSLDAGQVFDNAGRLVRALAHQWTLAGVLAAALGLYVLGRRQGAAALGFAVMMLLVAVYSINYDIPWEIEVYYIPIILVMAVLLGYASSIAPRLGLAAGAALCVLAALTNIGTAGRAGVDLVDRYGRDVLDALPEGAVLVTPSSNPTFILMYLTQVEELRPDVDVYVHGKQGLSRLGEAIGPGERAVTTRFALAGGDRPLYFAVREPVDDLPGFRLLPRGVLYRAARAGDAVESAGAWPELRVDPDAVSLGEDFRLRLIAARYYLARSDHHLARGDTTEAESDRAAALAVAGDDAAVHGALAVRYTAEDRIDDAIAAYQRAGELRDDAVLTNRLGRLHMQEGRVDLAEAAFRRAIDIDPEIAIGHSNLGALLGSRGDFQGAARELRLAIRYDPFLVKAYNNLALALLNLGDRAGAAGALRQSLSIHPDQPRIQAMLEQLSAR